MGLIPVVPATPETPFREDIIEESSFKEVCMWEVYVEHPIVGEIYLGLATEFAQLAEYPDEIDGHPVKYRYVD
jgi:hypothetical protein